MKNHQDGLDSFQSLNKVKNNYLLRQHDDPQALSIYFRQTEPQACLFFSKEGHPEILAEFLFNQDASAWMTHLAPEGSTIIIHKQSSRRLKNQQTVFLYDGDLLSFYGKTFQAIFRRDSLLLKPIPKVLHRHAAA